MLWPCNTTLITLPAIFVRRTSTKKKRCKHAADRKMVQSLDSIPWKQTMGSRTRPQCDWCETKTWTRCSGCVIFYPKCCFPIPFLAYSLGYVKNSLFGGKKVWMIQETKKSKRISVSVFNFWFEFLQTRGTMFTCSYNCPATDSFPGKNPFNFFPNEHFSSSGFFPQLR